MECSKVREEILGNGWHQGTTLCFTDAKDYIAGSSIEFTVRAKHQAHLMVISQDCDIANVGGDEPVIECLLLKKQKKPFSKNFNGHNPRKLHIELDDTCWEIQAKNSIFINKQFLVDNPCQSPLTFTPENIGLIKQWKANRYTRSGLPETFVTITRDTISNFESSTCLESYKNAIHSIRVYCEEKGESFDCSFVLLYKSEYCEQHEVSISDLEEAFNDSLLEPLSIIAGINLLNILNNDNIFDSLNLMDVMSDMEFTFGAARLFPRYYFDPISFTLGEGTEELRED